MSEKSYEVNAPDATVFDERQNTFRLRYGVEALSAFALLAIACCVSLDWFYKWSESVSCAVLVLAVLCLLWFLIRCAVKGCIAAASGRQAQKTAIGLTTLGAVMQSIRFSVETAENGVLKDGMLSNNFLFMVSSLLLVFCGVFSLCAIYKEEKANKKEEETSDEL